MNHKSPKFLIISNSNNNKCKNIRNKKYKVS